MRSPRQPRIYGTLKRRFTTQALTQLGFVREGSAMTRRGACRSLKATASSSDGNWWRVTPLVRRWR